MAQGKTASIRHEKASVATYADHEVISPPHNLRTAISKSSAALDADDDPVARAERALAQLSSEFSGWMHAECERLDMARRDVKQQGFTKKTREALFHAAHDIKGEAATLGFPWTAQLADSLCRLIEHTPDMTRIPIALVEQHVDAIRAVVRESARTDVAELAAALNGKLREVTDEFLAHENSDRPDLLEGILAPPLSPSETAF
jgi:HPt (histidine-containing phosphotransfer) domain-containing protein